MTFLYQMMENSGSHPEEVSAIMLIVPVGAMVRRWLFLLGEPIPSK